MTDKRREAVEKVFSGHGCENKTGYCDAHINSHGTYDYIPCRKLLDELAALPLEPVERLERQAVESVMREYLLSPYDARGVNQPDKKPRIYHEQDWVKFIDAICALAIPKQEEPSRVDLDKIFRKHHSCYGTGKDYPGSLKDEIMSWASRKPVERKWCEHIIKSPIATDKKEWHLQGKGIYCETFNFCPICSAPRPTGGDGG